MSASSICGSLVIVFIVLAEQSSSACAVCMGKQSGPLAEATNAAIFLMLGVLLSVWVLLWFGARSILAKAKASEPMKVRL